MLEPDEPDEPDNGGEEPPTLPASTAGRAMYSAKAPSMFKQWQQSRTSALTPHAWLLPKSGATGGVHPPFAISGVGVAVFEVQLNPPDFLGCTT